MRPPDAKWLDLSLDQRGWRLHDYGKLQYVVHEMETPTTQYPSVLFFIGRKQKTALLRTIYPGNNLARRSGMGIARLHVRLGTGGSRFPLLLGDSDSCRKLVGLKDPRHESSSDHRLTWSQIRKPNGTEILNHVYTSLIFPLTDVLCLFADDMGGLRKVQTLILDWVNTGPEPKLAMRPRILVVVNEDSLDPTEPLEDICGPQMVERISPMFSAISLVRLTNRDEISAHKICQPLQTALFFETEAARNHRINRKLLFSALHLEALFRRAIHHIVNQPDNPLDLIQLSRIGFPSPTQMQSPIRDFIGACIRLNVQPSAISKNIAAALLMDANPPHMHLFDPSTIFHELYSDVCQEACEESHLAAEMNLRESVLLQFCNFVKLLEHGTSSRFIRREILMETNLEWTALKTSYCLLCLSSSSLTEPLVCGHVACQKCIRNFGIPQSSHNFSISECEICRAKFEQRFRLKPFTAEPCIFIADGGGVKGLFTLKSILNLQRMLGDDDYPFQDHFDFAMGTSAGGIIALSLFAIGCQPKESRQMFLDFATKVFPSKNGATETTISQIRAHVSRVLKDRLYDPVVLEECLKKVFGRRRLFGVSEVQDLPGTKVAVTVSIVASPGLRIFSNVGVNFDNAELGFHHSRPEDPANEVLMWEAATCTSAAPGYFPPKYLPEYGALQDGGVEANCPVTPAVLMSKQIWPSTKPHLVLSFGTGRFPRPLSSQKARFRGIFKDGFPARLYRVLLNSTPLDAQKAWEEYVRSLPPCERARYFRINPIFIENEPELDDIDDAQFLERFTPCAINEQNIAEALWASSFYLELDDRPNHYRRPIHCHASIRSKIRNPLAVIQSIGRLYPYASFILVFTDGSCVNLGYVRDGWCGVTGIYLKRVHFDLDSATEESSLKIAFDVLKSQEINGSGRSLQWVQDQQLIDMPFGRPDHQENYALRVSCLRDPICGKGHVRQISQEIAAKRMCRW